MFTCYYYCRDTTVWCPPLYGTPSDRNYHYLFKYQINGTANIKIYCTMWCPPLYGAPRVIIIFLTFLNTKSMGHPTLISTKSTVQYEEISSAQRVIVSGKEPHTYNRMYIYYMTHDQWSDWLIDERMDKWKDKKFLIMND